MKTLNYELTGNDTDIETSLKEYGLVWIENETEYIFYYAIEWNEDTMESIRFDWASIDKDVDFKNEYNWADFKEVESYTGMNFDDMTLTQKITDLVSYYGYENVFGSSYDTGMTANRILKDHGFKIEFYIDPDKFIEYLPSGSGINCDYEYIEHQNGKVTFKNSFHAMNEQGGYDGYMDFKFTVSYSESDGFSFNRIVCNDNRRVSFFGLKDYLEETIDMAISDINELKDHDIITEMVI